MIRNSLTLCLLASTVSAATWEPIPTTSEPARRHEADFARLGEKFYLIGGRRNPPTDEFDPATNTWRRLSPAPLELHHTQVVPFENRLWVVGAMTGMFPNETPIDRVLIYDPAKDEWTPGPPIPADRRRGGAGAVVHDGMVYLVCGIQNGHQGGFVSWLDRFNPKTGEWTALADAPHARDHFQAAELDGKLYAVGGRRTSNSTGELMSLTVAEADVYDIVTGKWSTFDDPLPTPRAGTATAVIDGKIVVLGGESMSQKQAHAEVEALDPLTGEWETWPSLHRGRHGTGAPILDGRVYMASGSGGRGGGPELTSIEAWPMPN